MEGVIGTIIIFAGNFAPKSWAFCNGATIQIASNTALFSILGTTYGGNGTSNFQLPDLQGRVPIGAGNAPGLTPRPLGQKSGLPTTTINTSQMPAHTHPPSTLAIPVAASSGGQTLGANNILATPSVPIYTAANLVNANYGGISAQIAPVGAAQPINIVQPFLSVYYVICVQGIFPARN